RLLRGRRELTCQCPSHEGLSSQERRWSGGRRKLSGRRRRSRKRRLSGLRLHSVDRRSRKLTQLKGGIGNGAVPAGSVSSIRCGCVTSGSLSQACSIAI